MNAYELVNKRIDALVSQLSPNASETSNFNEAQRRAYTEGYLQAVKDMCAIFKEEFNKIEKVENDAEKKDMS